MNYELAKQLKDAGFPQKTLLGFPIHELDPYRPTLSELIEACGDNFLNMFKTKDGLFHCVNPFEGEDDVVGSTPEEAVAKLWLELNKKHE